MTVRSTLLGLDARISIGSKALSALGLLLLTTLALCIVGDVMLRWAFAAPIEGLSEVTSLVAAVTIASFLPLSLQLRQHASIRLMGKLFGVRAGAFFDRLSAIIVLGFFCLVAWQFARYTAELAEAGERTWILQLDVSYWWTAVSVLFGLAAVVQATHALVTLALGADAPSETM